MMTGRRLLGVLSLAAGLGAAGVTEAGTRVEVFVHVPPDAVGVGEQFEVPVFVRDGEEDVISYAFRLLYDRKVLKVVEIRGGTFEGFSGVPVVNRGSFETGKTDFTANNGVWVDTPADAFNIATITFEVVGRRGKRRTTKIRLRKTPRRDVTVRRTFRGARPLRFKKAKGIVRLK